ncbi:MAG TPA: uroporphyrinogen-III C-methyltransferase [Jiangellaceae bacterium]|nr:uroporphyrinogen-III C-methyltransferase [Jiangellaceae bacterium]
MTSGHAVTLDVTRRRVVVVGGGPVAARRAGDLVSAGADVLVVSPEVCEEVGDLIAERAVSWRADEYEAGDLDGAWLVHTATGDPRADAAVAADAETRRLWCVHAGNARHGTARTAATARLSDDLLVAVSSTPGTTPDPGRSGALRDAIAVSADSGRLPLRRRRAAPEPAGVFLVGGGPGHPALMTARGRQLLAAADVVVVDRLAPRSLLEDLEDDVVVVDVGKTPGHHMMSQDEINLLLVEHARAGRSVVRLKGGDPYVLGRGGEEHAACVAAGIPVEVVPGVTSAVAVPAAVGIPLTHRGVARCFTVVTGHDDLAAAPGGPDHTLVLLMGVARLAENAATIIAAGRPAHTPVAVVEDGFGPRQRATLGTLDTIAERAVLREVQPPAVIVVGDVVRLVDPEAAR